MRPELASEVQELAIRTFEAIGCEGLARVDVFVTHDGHVVVNEINTMPGFCPTLHVPADVGGQRGALSGAGRAVDHVGAAASRWAPVTTARKN